MQQNKQIHAFGAGCPVSCLASQGPSSIYLGTWDGHVLKLDLHAKKCTSLFKVDLNQNLPLRAFFCTIVAASTIPKCPPKFENNTGKNISKGKGSKGNVKANGKGKPKKEPKEHSLLFFSYGIGDVRSWNLRANAVHIPCYYGHTDVVNSIQVKDDWLWTVADDQTARLYDPNDGICLQVLKGHTNGLTASAICGPYFFTGIRVRSCAACFATNRV